MHEVLLGFFHEKLCCCNFFGLKTRLSLHQKNYIMNSDYSDVSAEYNGSTHGVDNIMLQQTTHYTLR